MKGNLGKILTIALPILAAAYLLWPTFESWRLEQKKGDYYRAKDTTGFNSQYKESYDKQRAKSIKLGLDLRGGMYVTLEIDAVRLLEEAAQRETRDELFQQVIAKTRQDAENTDEAVLDIFLRNFNAIARPQGRTLISYYDVSDLRDVSEERIIENLRKNIDEAIDQAQEVIRQRVDKYGVGELNLQKQGTRRIVLELPGVTNEAEMRQLLSTTARLEFKLVRNNAELVRAFSAVDRYMKNKKRGISSDSSLAEKIASAQSDTAKAIAKADSAKKDTTAIAKADSTKKDSTSQAAAAAAKNDTANPYAGLPKEEQAKRYREDHPFTTLFVTYFNNGNQFVPIDYAMADFPDGEYFFQIPEQTVREFTEIMSRPEVQRLFPEDLTAAVSAKSDRRAAQQGQQIFEIYGTKRDPELTGDVVTDARATFDPQSNSPMVLMSMNPEGSERWGRITGANLQKRIAIVLDERVYSAPVVQSKISGGSSQITGMANVEEARLLEIVLKAGALKAPVRIIEERVVGPSLGEDSIRAGLTASAFALALVVLFMIVYYRTGGVIADLAVVVNVLLVLAALAAFKGTLTLPGIAGVILTIGMAVDANILIYERIREELRRGRTLRAAIDVGFSKALSAILDSNITTFLTGLMLYIFGSGPIQGFAVTLMIGILTTLFTGIVVSRAMIELMISRGATGLSFGQPTHTHSTVQA